MNSFIGSHPFLCARRLKDTLIRGLAPLMLAVCDFILFHNLLREGILIESGPYIGKYASL